MEDQNNGNVPATGTTKKGNFLSSRWAMITATAIIAIIVGFLLGHCCHHRRHCCGDRCEMGRGALMMISLAGAAEMGYGFSIGVVMMIWIAAIGVVMKCAAARWVCVVVSIPPSVWST